jgi:predicted nucleotidyltransferase
MTTRRLKDVDVQGVTNVLSEQSDIVASYLFGSAARDQMTRSSDVDIAVLLDQTLDDRAMVLRQLDLTVALESHSDRDVQVILLNQATPLLAYQVLREGVRLTQRSDAERIDFEVRTMKLYFDVQPMLAFQKEQLFERIQEVGLGRTPRRDHSSIEAAERLLARLEKSSGR